MHGTYARERRIRSRAAVWLAAVLSVLPTAVRPAGASAQAPDTPLLRWQYFQEQRAFPGTSIPVGALQRAKIDLRNRWPELFLQRNGNAAAAFELSTSAWTAIGPAPIDNGSAGRLNAIAVHPSDPNTIYIGGAQGGVWKTTDGGASWTPRTDDQCSLAMGSIAIDPVNPDIVYAGTGELNFSSDSYYGCGVLRSTDAGLTWTQLGAQVFASGSIGARISRIIIDGPTAGSTSATSVLAATSVGLWISRDSGLSWNLSLSGVISDLQVDAASPSILYAAVGLPATQASNGVYKSIDTGSTWTRLVGFPSNDVGRIALGSSPTVPGLLYAAVQNGFDGDNDDGQLLGIWSTADGGTTWTQRNSSQTSCNSQCWYNLVIAVDPADPATIWFGGVPLFRSTDAGSTFQNVLRGAHVDQHAITFDPSDPATVYIGNDGGVYRSRNDAVSWESLNNGISITQFYAGVSLHPTDTTIVLGGTQDNGTLEANGTGIWSVVHGADGGFTAIDHVNPLYSWAETQWASGSGFAGPRLRTGNGSFERRVNGIDTNDRALFIPPLVMDPNNPQTLYFGTYRIYRTTSRGAIWGTISPDLTVGPSTNGRISAIAPSESDPATIWVGASNSNVQVTRDNGVTWNLRNAGLPRRYVTDIAVDAEDPETAVLSVSGFDSGHVFRTADGGVTWADISGDLPNVPVLAVLTDPALGDAIYIGTDLGVFRTFDTGASWEPFMDGLPNVAVFDLTFNRGTGIAVAATHGRSTYAFRPTSAAVLAINSAALHLVSVGDTARLSAVALDLNGDTIDAAPVWHSLDVSIATVDRAGLVTSIGNGETHIVARFGGAADTASISVRQIAAEILGLPATLQLVQGETRILGVRAVDALGEIIEDIIEWRSTNPAVVTIDAQGRALGVGVGAAEIHAEADGIVASSTIQVAAPSTATIVAASAAETGTPLSSAGSNLHLLRLEVDVDGLEAIRLTRLVFEVSGRDPQAKLLVVNDVNDNGRFDPEESSAVGSTVVLADEDAVATVDLQPADMRIEGGSRGVFLVVLQLSGGSPNGTTFQATYRPEQTTSVGTRSGQANRLVLPSDAVASGLVQSTLLAAQDILTFSENPVRSDRVIFNFREAPTVAAVFTVTGRQVIDLTRLIEGTSRIDWDLRNGDGERVAPGVYLVIFNVGGTVMRERLLVLPPRDPEPGRRSHQPADGRS